MLSRALLPLAIAALLLSPLRAAGAIVEIIDESGDGTHPLTLPIDVAIGAGGEVDEVGNGGPLRVPLGSGDFV